MAFNAGFQANSSYADNPSYFIIFYLDTVKIMTSVGCKEVISRSNMERGTWINNLNIIITCKVHTIIIINNGNINIRCNYYYIIFVFFITLPWLLSFKFVILVFSVLACHNKNILSLFYLLWLLKFYKFLVLLLLVSPLNKLSFIIVNIIILLIVELLNHATRVFQPSSKKHAIIIVVTHHLTLF